MDTLASSLSAHQKGPARRPALNLTLQNSRHRRPLLNWTRYYSGAENNGPCAAALTAAGTLIRAHNDAGTLKVSRVASPDENSTYTSWSTVDASATPGTGVALCALPAELVLLYVKDSGDDLTVRTSTDDGATWSSASTILSETTNPISWVALGSWNGVNTNLCAFYLTQPSGSETLLRRVRRTSGVWAGSGTTWTRGSYTDQLTGISAYHDSGDYQLVITGTAATTGKITAWGTLMGDLALPSNAWALPQPIVEFDSASTVNLSAPSVFRADLNTYATFAQQETGDVAHFRNHATVVEATNADAFLEPYPIEPANTHEAAVTGYRNLASELWMVTPNGVWKAELGETRSLGTRVLAARWSFGPSTHSAEFVVDNTDGALLPGASESSDAIQIRPGMDLQLFAGYGSGTDGAGQFGQARRFVIQSVEHVLDRTSGASLTSDPSKSGRRNVKMRCGGPWTTLRRWRAPRAISIAESTESRIDLVRRYAGRAGIQLLGTAGTDMSTQEPGFALNPGESADVAIQRLMAPADEVLRTESGDLTIAVAPTSSSEDYGGAAEHPVSSAIALDPVSQHNWHRTVGPDRYADAYDFEAIAREGQAFDVSRQLFATTDAIAEDYAERTLERLQRDSPRLRLTVPYHAGQTLWDVVTVTVPELDIEAVDYRVIGLTAHYERGPAGARFDHILELGEV